MGNDTTLTYDGDFVDAGGGMLSIADQTTLFYNNNVHTNQNKLYLGEVTAEDTELTPGDLWWSEQNGRLYIYFNDFDSSQWVCTQPIGKRPWVRMPLILVLVMVLVMLDQLLPVRSQTHNLPCCSQRQN